MDTKEKKYAHGKNPNSIKNLKPIQKGENRNPLGAGAHDKEKKQWKDATIDYVREIINITVMGQPSELKAIYESPETARDAAENAKRVMAKYVHNAIETGNWPAIERILERVIGKVPEKIEHTVLEKIPLTKEEINEQLAKLRAARGD